MGILSVMYFIGIVLSASKDECQNLRGSFEYEYVLCFEFQCEIDEVIDLDQGKMPSVPTWFKKPDIIKDMLTKVQQFTRFASANMNSKKISFVITSEANSSTNFDTAVNLVLYQAGLTLESNFIPPLAPELNIANVTASSVAFSWNNLASSCDIDEFVVAYQAKDCSSTQWEQQRVQGIISQTTIENLSPNKAYMFKIFCDTKYGLSVESKVVEQVTIGQNEYQSKGKVQASVVHAPATHHPPIKQQSIGNSAMRAGGKICSPGKPTAAEVNKQDVTIMWPAPSENLHLVSHYSIHYRKYNKPQSSSTKVEARGTTNRKKINNLELGTGYIFFVVAHCDSGEYKEGEESEIITTKEGPCSSPGKPQAIKIEAFSVSLKWSPPARKAIAIQSYTVYYYTQTNPNAKLSKRVPSMTTEISIGQLQPNTTYLFQVIGNCNTGESVESAESDPITTEQCICSQPGRPWAQAVSKDSITLAWDAPMERSQYIQYYYVYYMSFNNHNNKWAKINIQDSNRHIEITHLTVDTSYVFKIIAHCQFGDSVESEQSDVITTTHTVCSKPGKPRAYEVTHTSVGLTWKQPDSLSECVTSYYVFYSSLKHGRKQWAIAETEDNSTVIRIDGLEPDTKYVFKIVGKCDSCNSKESDESDVITTKRAVCSAPGKPVACEVTHDKVSLKWPAPKQCAECVIVYYVCYRSINDKKWMMTESEDATPEVEIGRLQPNKTYEFKVVGRCDYGTSEESKVSKITTTNPVCSAPGRPRAFEVTQNKIKLTWAAPESGAEFVQYYDVYYCPESKKSKWERIETKNNTQEIAILQLKPATSYYCKVVGHCSAGNSDESEISDPIKTDEEVCGPPGQPEASQVTKNSASLNWSQPKEMSNLVIKLYHILYCDIHDPSSKWIEATTTSATEAEVTGLKPTTEYQFKVVAECTNGIYSKESKVSNVIETRALTLVDKYLPQLKLIPSSIDDDLSFYRVDKLMKEEMRDKKNRIARFSFEKPSDVISKVKGWVTKSPEEKVLLVVGATGAGKSTLINGIVNYIFGVEWDDKYRIKLILDKTSESQAHSQTAWITAYTFYWQQGFPFPYTLTIIDTPGFGDTQGIERDKEIVHQIKHLFEKDCGVDVLHAIGFVVPAPLARPTQTQCYIFDSILALFGRDVADNICVMATFADGGKPPVTEVIKVANVPHKHIFKFNNSALFQHDDDGFAKMFWQMGIKSCKNFFDFLSNAKVSSLQMTREVLKVRKHLETCVSGIRPQTKLGLSKMDELRQEEQILRNHESQIKGNENFTYEVELLKIVKKDVQPGTYVTNCHQCNITCCANCRFADDNDKQYCGAMKNHGPNATCAVCPGGCHWKLHKNNSFYFDTYTVKEKRTFADLERKYKAGVAGKNKVEGMIVSINKEIEEISEKVLCNIQEVCRCLDRLSEIALKPDPITDTEYIDLLIEGEKKEAKPGYQQRTKGLQLAKEKALLIAQSQYHKRSIYVY